MPFKTINWERRFYTQEELDALNQWVADSSAPKEIQEEEQEQAPIKEEDKDNKSPFSLWFTDVASIWAYPIKKAFEFGSNIYKGEEWTYWWRVQEWLQKNLLEFTDEFEKKEGWYIKDSISLFTWTPEEKKKVIYDWFKNWLTVLKRKANPLESNNILKDLHDIWALEDILFAKDAVETTLMSPVAPAIEDLINNSWQENNITDLMKVVESWTDSLWWIIASVYWVDDLSEEWKNRLWAIAWETITAWWWALALKSVKNIIKTWKGWKMDAVDEINKTILENKQASESNMFGEEVDETLIRDTLNELDINIEKWRVSEADIATVVKDLNLNDWNFWKDKLNNSLNEWRINAKKEADSFSDLLWDVAAKKNNKNYEKLVNDWYSSSLKKAEKNAIIKNSSLSEDDAKKALTQRSKTMAWIMEDLAWNNTWTIKAMDIDWSFVKGNDLKKMLDAWLLKISKDIKNELTSFKLTNKWTRVLADTNLPEATKTKFIEQWFAHYPKDKWWAVNWDLITKAKELQTNMWGVRDFKLLWDAIFNKEIGKWGKVIDFDIVARMEAINENFKLNLWKEISEIVDTFWDVDNKKMMKVADKMAELKHDNFIKYSNIKPLASLKSMRDKIISKSAERALYQEWKRIGKAVADTKINIIKQKHKVQKSKIEEKYKDRIKQRDWLLYRERVKAREREMLIRAKQNSYNDIHTLIRENIIDAYNMRGVKHMSTTMVKKITTQLDWANTPWKINAKIDAINKELTVQYAKDLFNAMKDELDIRLKDKNARSRYDVEIYTKLQSLNQIITRIWTNDLPIASMKSLYNRILQAKDDAKLIASSKNIKTAEHINKRVAHIKKEEIVDVGALENIKNKRVGVLKRALASAKSFHTWTTFYPTLMKKMFWQKWTALKEFVTDPNSAMLKSNLFFEEHTQKVWAQLFSLLGEEAWDWWAFMFTKRKTYHWVEVEDAGFDRIVEDLDWPAYQKRETQSRWADEDLPQDFPLTMEQWTSDVWWVKFKNTKLWEMMENYDNPKWKKASELWSSYQMRIWGMVKKVAREEDFTNMEIYDDYFTFKRMSWKEEDILDMWLDRLESTIIADWFTKKVTKVKKWESVNYEYNPISLLTTSWRAQVYYAHMKPAYNNMKNLLEGKTIKYNKLSADELKKVNKESNYRLIDSDWKEIDLLSTEPVKQADWLEYANTSEWLLLIDDLTIKTWKWLRDWMSKSNNLIMNNYMELTSKWWNFANNRGEKIFSWFVNQANLIPLLLKASVVLKQPLSLIDAMWDRELWVKAMISWMADLNSHPSIYKELSKVEAVRDRKLWDPLLREAIEIIDTWWVNIFKKLHRSIVKVWVAPMWFVDRWVYSNIFYVAYKQYMIKNNLLAKNLNVTKFDNKRALDYASNKANDIASTANPLWMPPAYKSIYTKIFFWIFTTQLKRLDKVVAEVPHLWKNWEKGQAMIQSMFFLTSNVAELSIRYAMWKAMVWLWISTYDKYEEDFLDLMLSYDSLFEVTAWQFLLPSKIKGWYDFWTFKPTDSFVKNIIKDVKKVVDWDVVEWLTDLSADTVFGWWTKDIVKYFRNK